MVVVSAEARKLRLPKVSLSSSPQINSLLYEPKSLCLALMHSDSTISLFPSFSPFSLSSASLPPPQTVIPPPSSSACFVSLNANPNPKTSDGPEVVFVAAGPHNGGSRVALRFYLLGKDGKFDKVEVGCSQKGISFDRKSGVIVDASHGMKVLIGGSVNYLAMYSATARKGWVFGVKLGANERDLRLVKCAVIDCHLPVVSICISYGFLVLGELNGVRVFPLRALVKGRVGSRRRSRVVKGKIENLNREQQDGNVGLEGPKSKTPNGVIGTLDERYELGKNSASMNVSKPIANGYVLNALDGVSSKSNSNDNGDAVKPRSLKFRQDSGEVGVQFVLFDDSIVEGTESKVPGYKTRNAISIRAFSHRRFLILDSNGELHVLHMSKSGCFEMRKLTGIFQVQQLAVFPDMSANTQNAWISDGLCSLHKLMISETDTAENENDKTNIEGKSIQCSVFSSENIQDVIALGANSIMILGQDNLYAYAIS